MNTLISLHNAVFDRLERQDWILPTLARFIFVAVLFMYFWNSGLTKLGDGIFGIFVPSTGAYAQIWPKVLESVSYDTSQLGIFHWAVVWAGTVAEFVLPLAILAGLATRLAALGMIGFVVVQSLTDIYGHGAGAETIGAWFDRVSDAHILDQRAFWVFLLLVLVIKGAGPLSVDRILASRREAAIA
ncbi:MAG: DoxX family protein [Cognatishimia sp.]|uniref:DoxX family protein n=1 Tax=Cognatishimia sp. 1_MG-2023 TaxID=3062642 RepID=UPI0026E1BE20|nr:DoxX family protein [Cognatishimia sp. 1_MG-2023]MDO6726440.1 DoxX family protein [Cognatishimia sp. 1_MG-2023]